MSNDKAILDAKKGNWVDRYSPASIRPFLKLSRVDRPIGIWLLLWPATWAITMAGNFASYPDLKILGLFLLGAFVMRSAGCSFNDIVDRDYDSKVARTRNRPIAGKEISVQNAWLFLATLRWIQKQPLVRAWYERKLTRNGGNKMKAIIALMRKLLAGLYHVSHGRELDLTKLFDVRGLVVTAA